MRHHWSSSIRRLSAPPSSDAAHRREVTREEAAGVATAFLCSYHECSARRNDGVVQAFQALLALINATYIPMPLRIVAKARARDVSASLPQIHVSPRSPRARASQRLIPITTPCQRLPKPIGPRQLCLLAASV